jgi:hypothetical protein
MNIRGPFGESTPGPFGMVGAGIIAGSTDRPEIVHRGVRVARCDANTLTQVDVYPNATGWTDNDDGTLDIWCENARVQVVATYPSGQWQRVWFLGAEHKIQFVVPDSDEDENEESDDVEHPLINESGDDLVEPNAG